MNPVILKVSIAVFTGKSECHMVAGADHLDTDSGGSLFNGLLHKFYAASISIDPAGAMLVTSTRDRIMAWGMLFCLIAFVCLADKLE